MTITRHESGPRMSHAVVYNGMVFLAGQVASETAGRSVGEQTAEILKRIEELLAKAGSDKSKMLSTTIYLADISTFAEMNAVWDAWVDKANPPARATVEAKLAAPKYTVEIVVVAAA